MGVSPATLKEHVVATTICDRLCGLVPQLLLLVSGVSLGNPSGNLLGVSPITHILRCSLLDVEMFTETFVGAENPSDAHTHPSVLSTLRGDVH